MEGVLGFSNIKKSATSLEIPVLVIELISLLTLSLWVGVRSCVCGL